MLLRVCSFCSGQGSGLSHSAWVIVCELEGKGLCPWERIYRWHSSSSWKVFLWRNLWVPSLRNKAHKSWEMGTQTFKRDLWYLDRTLEYLFWLAVGCLTHFLISTGTFSFLTPFPDASEALSGAVEVHFLPLRRWWATASNILQCERHLGNFQWVEFLHILELKK